MGVGTSLGAYFDDDFHHSTAQWDPKYDENEYTTDGIVHDNTPVEVKDQMPFPDNVNPDSNFVNRFGNLPPSGILNDLKKPTDSAPPLVRKIANITNTPGEIMDGLEGSRAYPSGFSSPERVKSAALQHNGETYEDINHGLALGRIMDKFPDVDMKKIKDGFTTTHGRFVSREEAMGIAQGQGQINHPDIPNYGMLLSEDLVQ